MCLRWVVSFIRDFQLERYNCRPTYHSSADVRFCFYYVGPHIETDEEGNYGNSIYDPQTIHPHGNSRAAKDERSHAM